MAYDVLIKGGTVVTAEGCNRADVAIKGGKIAAVGRGLSGVPGGIGEMVDAKGKYVIPGAVDAHVHLELPFCGTVSSDDWISGTRAAARGGVTTVIDFATPYGKDSLEKALSKWSAKAKGKAYIDYSFHMCITDWDRQGKDIPKLIKMGCPTFKQFMIYESQGWRSDDRAIYCALEACKKHGGMLMVHAESSHVLNELVSRHHTPAMMKKHGAKLHGVTRPWFVEAEAVQRAVMWAEATGGRLYVVHMSGGPGAEIVSAAQKRGVDVLTETCPQYLTLTDSVFAKTEGHLYASCPQVKKKSDQDRLWTCLKQGGVSIVATDTCTFTRSQKAMWKGDWTRIPMGLPGVETMVPIVFTHGVLKKRMTISRMVAVCCTNPAKVMGLYPRKGTIAKGSDADLAIIDPSKRTRVDFKKLETNADWSPYQGWNLAGFAETTFSRGRKVVDQYEVVGEQGWGQWLPRKKPGRPV